MLKYLINVKHVKSHNDNDILNIIYYIVCYLNFFTEVPLCVHKCIPVCVRCTSSVYNYDQYVESSVKLCSVTKMMVPSCVYLATKIIIYYRTHAKHQPSYITGK